MKNNEIMSKIIHYMKYAKYVESEQRRETFEESVGRNKKMHIGRFPEIEDQIGDNFDFVLDKKVIPSMRSMQFAGEAISVSPSRMFNCCYLPVKDIRSFSEAMFLLLSGCGVGYSVQKNHVDCLPEIRKPTKTRRYLIQDSIEGWADSIKMLMKAYFANKSEPLFDFRSIRPKGSLLITSGGKAPGPEPLIVALNKIRSILNNKKNGDKITPLECHDIMCIIADAVLAGGIRRSAMISLFSIDDEEMLKCKTAFDVIVEEKISYNKESDVHHLNVSVYQDSKFYKKQEIFISGHDYKTFVETGKIQWYYFFPERSRSNNSMVVVRNLIDEKKFKEKWRIVEKSGSGEPGFYFTNNAELGTNPCCEISLLPYQFCNLTSVNVSDVETQEDLEQRVKAAAFIGTLQCSYTDFHYLRPEWKKNTEKEALLGVSLTGIASINHQEFDFESAAKVACDENKRVAKLIGVNPASRVTCIKPEGTGSLVLGTSSGIHAWHSDFYKRRIRVDKKEPIYSYLINKIPELVEDEVFGNGAVITIPMSCPENAKTRDEDVLSFLDRIKYMTNNWIKPGHNKGMNTHNVSATVSVKDGEWDFVGNWLWENQDSFNGLSFLPFDNGTYVQAPFEDCSQEDFDKLSVFVKDIDLTEIKEEQDGTNLQGELACSGASCEVF